MFLEHAAYLRCGYIIKLKTKLNFLFILLFVISPTIAMERSSSLQKSEEKMSKELEQKIDILFDLAYKVHAKCFERGMQKTDMSMLENAFSLIFDDLSSGHQENLKSHCDLVRKSFEKKRQGETFIKEAEQLFSSFEEQLKNVSNARQGVTPRKLKEDPYQDFLHEDEA